MGSAAGRAWRVIDIVTRVRSASCIPNRRSVVSAPPPIFRCFDNSVTLFTCTSCDAQSNLKQYLPHLSYARASCLRFQGSSYMILTRHAGIRKLYYYTGSGEKYFHKYLFSNRTGKICRLYKIGTQDKSYMSANVLCALFYVSGEFTVVSVPEMRWKYSHRFRQFISIMLQVSF